jgi:hypothetical protein
LIPKAKSENSLNKTTMEKSNMITVNKVCPMCGIKHNIDVDKEKYNLWLDKKMLIQNAFPDFSPEYREILMTGLCIKCQDVIFHIP